MRVVDGTSEHLSEPVQVLVIGYAIARIAPNPITPPPELALTRIEGGGRTLMPGLIDANTPIMLATLRRLRRATIVSATPQAPSPSAPCRAAI